MTRRDPAAVACLFALSLACSPKFDGPEKVEGLRLLAISAEPPEIGAPLDGSGAAWPAGSATLRSLVGHPDFAVDGATRAVVLHLACTPTPGDVAFTACTTMTELSEPSDFLPQISTALSCTAPGQGAEGAVTFSGLEVCSRDGCGPILLPLDPAAPSTTVALPSPRYTLPPDFTLASLPEGDTQRVLGVDVVDLALVVEASPQDLSPATAVQDACAALSTSLSNLASLWPLRSHLAAIKWIHVRGPDMPAASPPNQNPLLSGISLGGTALPGPAATPLAVTEGASQALLPILPGPFDTLRQQFQVFDTNGHYVDTQYEQWAYSWFSTSGDLLEAHTSSDNPDNRFNPASGAAMLWLVVRDLRGGEAFTAGAVLSP